MKIHHTRLLLGCFILAIITVQASAIPRAGFWLPDSIQEVTIRYKRAQNLILLPVTINDTIHLNLILDTGCRNLVLFGKRFRKMFTVHPTKTIQFSGLGAGKPVVGSISLNNKVSIDAVLGERIPVVLVRDQNLFGMYTNVDGIIGYDVFIKFEIELNPSRQTITFRPAFTAELAAEYLRIPIRVEDSRPFVDASVSFHGKDPLALNLMIDTGSSLGLLLKTGQNEKYLIENKHRVLGRGLNGNVEGSSIIADKLVMESLELNSMPAGIIYSEWPDQASIGMDILKQYSFVLNYCKGYAGLKREFYVFSNPGKRTQKPPGDMNF